MEHSKTNDAKGKMVYKEKKCLKSIMKSFILKNQKNVRKLNPQQAEAKMYNKGKKRKQ